MIMITMIVKMATSNDTSINNRVTIYNDNQNHDTVNCDYPICYC